MTVRAFDPGAVTGGSSGMTASFAVLERELRPLCRGLAHSRLSRLEAVSTVARLPEGTTHELALRWLCEELADEFGLRQTVRRDGEVWAVRFARSLPPEPGRGEGSPVLRSVRAGLMLVQTIARSLHWGLQHSRHRGRSAARAATTPDAE